MIKMTVPIPTIRLKADATLSGCMLSPEFFRRIDALPDRRVRIKQPADDWRRILLGQILLREAFHGRDERINIPRRGKGIAIGGALLCTRQDRKSTRLNSSHSQISYA